jgi:hypothetical protein
VSGIEPFEKIGTQFVAELMYLGGKVAVPEPAHIKLADAQEVALDAVSRVVANWVHVRSVDAVLTEYSMSMEIGTVAAVLFAAAAIASMVVAKMGTVVSMPEPEQETFPLRISVVMPYSYSYFETA